MDIDVVNRRVDKALSANGRAERVIIGLAICIFGLGAASLAFAYWHANPYIAGGTLLLQWFLYWPIREIRQLRRENISLQAVPVLVGNFPPDRAMQEIAKLLEFIRRGRE